MVAKDMLEHVPETILERTLYKIARCCCFKTCEQRQYALLLYYSTTDGPHRQWLLGLLIQVFPWAHLLACLHDVHGTYQRVTTTTANAADEKVQCDNPPVQMLRLRFNIDSRGDISNGGI
jgi:hypothetical protein